MNKITRIFSFILLSALLIVTMAMIPSLDAGAKPRTLVIVLDPGHGGTELGAITKGRMEKELNYRVAMAMKNELMKYEGVEVYITRDGDTEISLKDRAVFAKECKADLLVSLHFNASETHQNYGVETYVSVKEPLKTKGERFADIELKLLEQYGIPIKGNFTRLSENNNDDYYGIIRESASRGIPAVIVEHCYLDIASEEQFYDTPDDLERLGKIDATAVAMTYRLKSEELGVDYSKLKSKDIILPEHIMDKDLTPPEVSCKLLRYNESTRRATFRIEVSDGESPVVSYALSKDGGNQFTPERSLFFTDTFETEYIIKNRIPDTFVVAAYNAYGVAGFSEPLDINSMIFPEGEEPEEPLEIVWAYIEPLTYAYDNFEISAKKENSPLNIALFWSFGSFGVVCSAVIAFIEFRKRRG